jgi:hypothetical protein
MPQHDRRSVAGNFDHVFGGVRTRAFVESDDYLVDGVTFGIGQFGKLSGPCAPCRGMAKAEDNFGNRASFGARDPYDAQTPAAGGSGNGNYGVVEIQNSAIAAARPA